MKAIVQGRYGSAGVLELRDIEGPVPGPDQVLIRVRAAGVNMADWHMMAGQPKVMRLFGVGFCGPKAKTRGTDVAGVVEGVGSAVTEFKPGDEVFGSASGSFAEFALSTETRLLPKPQNVTFEQASAVAMVSYTALQALRVGGVTLGELAGQRVLVIGAAGGVGSMAVLLAKHFGATVTGVCSTSKVDFVLSLGAEDVIDYKNSPLLGTYDAIIDTAGGRNLDVLRRRLTRRGRLVMVGAENVGIILGLVKRMLRAFVYSPFVSQKLITLMADESPDDLVTIRDLLASGAVTVPIERTFPLAKAANAIRHLEAGLVRGKVVVTVP